MRIALRRLTSVKPIAKMEAYLPPFPVDGLLPKKETQALDFIQRHQTRGKGVRVAVLDSGVDPQASGLRSRVVDLIDASGSGDVQLTDASILEESNGTDIFLRSLTGRTLKVSTAFTNPTNAWRVGYKRAYDFWPGSLVDRRKKERKEAFDRAQQSLLANVHRELSAFNQKEASDKKTKAASSEKKVEKVNTTKANGPVETTEQPDTEATDKKKHESDQLLKKKDLEDRISSLTDLSASFEDQGPIIETVAWHDGKDWRCNVAGGEGEDEDEGRGIPINSDDGKPVILDMTHLKPMTDFRKERHFERFGAQDMLTFSVNFYDDGRVLSLVTQANAHGTHVASIIAADHPDRPELNGVAPDVEIVGIKIADSRLHGIETNQALWRAARAIIDTNCDIANMSYGEDGSFGLEGRGTFISQMVEEVVRKKGIPFCVSAGNNGPALSTVGWPAACDAAVFSVGAWVSKAMQASEYALIDSVPSSIYTWSSRGPLTDGSRGVHMYAPGGAITSVPQYTLDHTQLMNGTSMSSPNCCGTIALLISALKENKIPYSPASLRKSIQATAKDVGDSLGVGMIQVNDAYNYLEKHQNQADIDAEWIVEVSPAGRGEPMHGVYLRTQQETSTLQQFAAKFSPKFLENQPDKRYGVEMNLALVCNKDWVQFPKFVATAGAGRMFAIRVDASKLESGLHYTSVDAYHQSEDGSRLIASIPITVAKPVTPEQPNLNFKHIFQPGEILRKFVQIPEGATWAEVKLKSSDRATPSQIWLHVVQIHDLQRISKLQTQHVFPLVSGEPITKRIRLTGGLPLEFCLTQGWNAPFSTTVEVGIEFHGLSVLSSTAFDAGRQLQTITLKSSLRPESLAGLEVSFNSKRHHLRSTSNKIESLSARSELANRQSLFALNLEYSLKQSKKANVTITTAQPENLYDSSISTLFVVLDKNKRIVHSGDMYATSFDLDKGDYTVKAQFCSPHAKVLEGLKSACLQIDTKLDGKAKDVKLAFYRDHVDGIAGNDPLKVKEIKLRPGEHRSFCVKTALSDDAAEEIYKDTQPGQLLIGSCHVATASHNVGRPASLNLPPAPAKSQTDEDSPEKPNLLSLQLEMAKKIDDAEQKQDFLASLSSGTDAKDELRLAVARLDAVSDSTKSNDVLEKAAIVINSIDENDLTHRLSTGKTAETKSEKKEAKWADEEKAALINALYRRAEAVFSRKSDERNGNAEEAAPKETFYRHLQRWQDANDKKLLLLGAQRDVQRGLFGSALIKTKKVLDNFGPGSTEEDAIEAREIRRDAIKALDWRIYVQLEDKAEVQNKPPSEFAF